VTPQPNGTPPAAPGRPWPLGVHLAGQGGPAQVAVVAPHADWVDLCLLDGPRAGGTERRVRLIAGDAGVWHASVPGIAAGQRYGFRLGGPWAPEDGVRCNPAKLLADPWARAFTGDLLLHQATYAHVGGADAGDPYGRPDGQDSAPYVPHSVVVAPLPPPGPRPDVDPADRVVYEAHVGGLTARHPAVPEQLRGTYLGLAHPAVVDHLLRLGVTTVELLPVTQFVSEAHLLRRGMRNAWGYNTLGHLAPHEGYATAPGRQVEEFRALVDALHAAGLEVWLDVVLNHTAEGGAGGPTLCWRGFDEAGSYRMHQAAGRLVYDDVTGCGNTFDLNSPDVLALALGSLRHWVQAYGVDGFRFDLAVALGRTRDGDFDPAAPFLAAAHADPVLREVRLVAEPWDVGWGGYQLGRFPVTWAEWNGRFRDDVRRSLQPGGTIAGLGAALTGSADLTGRRPATASVNLVTVHDGFPLADLVSYERKHNEDNGEGNRDGDDSNHSSNGGVEGPTADPAVLALRRARRRAFLALVALATGTPLLCYGDELGRTQFGNNNAYCRPELLAVDWSAATDPCGPDPSLPDYVASLYALRRRHPALRRTNHFTGEPDVTGRVDVRWLHPDGRAVTETDWQTGRALGMLLDGTAAGVPRTPRNAHGRADADLLLWVALGETPVPAALPPGSWAVALDTSRDTAVAVGGGAGAAPRDLVREGLQLQAPAVVLLERVSR
jgi:glycogen operon protein